MGMYGTIVVFPTAGAPPEDIDAKARELISCFERLGLLVEGTAATCETPQPWNGRFAELRNQSAILPEDYVLYLVKPERILPELAKLVMLFTPEDIGMEEADPGLPGPFALPDIQLSVIRTARPIVRSADGEEMANTWATIEFSYADCRYHPEVHRIVDENHPLFAELAKAFCSPVAWDVDIG